MAGGDENNYGPLWQLRQNLDTKQKLQASLRLEAETKLKKASALEAEIEAYESAITQLEIAKASA